MTKFIRWFLGKVILFLDAVFAPRPLSRESARQAEVDKATSGLVLYQFEACPFCVKVRRTIRKLNLKIILKDANKVPAFGEELVKGGGLHQVPCLRIAGPDGKIRWLYESTEINAYLKSEFA